MISKIFHREDVDAIYRIPLSRRQVGDFIFWVHTRNGGYSVKFGYHVAREVIKHEGWRNALVEVICSRYGKPCGR